MIKNKNIKKIIAFIMIVTMILTSSGFTTFADNL